MQMISPDILSEIKNTILRMLSMEARKHKKECGDPEFGFYTHPSWGMFMQIFASMHFKRA